MSFLKVCIVTNPTSPATDYYRSVAPFHYIEKATRGAIQVRCIQPARAEWHTFFTSDIIFFSRPNGPDLLDIVGEVKNMGKFIWSDYDDLLDGLSDFNPAKVHFGRPEVIESVKQIIALSDVVTVSTRFLQEKYQQYTQNEVHVLKNTYDNYYSYFPPIRPQGEPIKLLWRGSATHLGDLMTVKSAIDYAITSEKWRVKFFGLQKWMLHAFPDGYEMAGWENRLFTYFRRLSNERPDWVIFPLINDPFNQGKSNISAIEALTAGAGVLAPSGFPEFVMPGIINYESTEHLKDLLNQIENKEIEKESTVQEGRRWLQEMLNVERENEKRMKIIAGLTGAKIRKTEKSKIE